MSKKNNNKVQYTIEYIDVNNNGKVDKGDADLVKMYVNGKLQQQYLVPHKTMGNIASQAMNSFTEMKNSKKNTTKKSNKSPLVTPKRNSTKAPKQFEYTETIPDPNAPQNQNKPVIVQDNTGFVQYVKAGAGLEAGRLATDAVVNALSGLFSSSDDGGDEE